MSETIEQQIIRNIQGNFAVYKTTEVVGDKALVPNLEWEESEAIDKFFMFAKNMGIKVIYVTEGEEDQEDGSTTTSIVQIGFLHQGIMHHIDFSDDEEYDDEDEADEASEEDDDVEEYDDAAEPETPNSQPSNQFIGSNSL